MLRQCRHRIVNQLWQTYCDNSSQMKQIESALLARGIPKLKLDHFAIIDLPGPSTGIYHLKEVFAALGFTKRGEDYLPEKQNDFLWMAEADSMHLPATEALPQVVVADFRLEEMPVEIRSIIEKYGKLARPSPLFNIKKLLDHILMGERAAADVLETVCLRYFKGRDWELPTCKDYQTVYEFNELLAWVLVFGRRPNHFTLSVHLMDHFSSLDEFHHFIRDELELALNVEGGVIKGGIKAGIAQGSTVGITQQVALADGTIAVAMDFVEFVWRYPGAEVTQTGPLLWGDYFTGFVAQFADRVIESLYTGE